MREDPLRSVYLDKTLTHFIILHSFMFFYLNSQTTTDSKRREIETKTG